MPFVDPRQPRRFVFIAVPKTACSAIATGLRLERMEKYGLHAPRSELPKWPNVTSFGFVRNPWDRQLSLYSFMAQHKRPRWYDRDKMRSNGFKWWLFERWWTAEDRSRGRLDQPPIQRRPLSWYVAGCDCVGRYEHLESDLGEILASVGWGSWALGVKNASWHPPYREVYDDEMRNAVAEWFATDIAEFGYEF